MLKIAVCDDEINEISSISSFINTYMAEHDIPISYKCYTSSVELASKAAYEKYDLSAGCHHACFKRDVPFQGDSQLR